QTVSTAGSVDILRRCKQKTAGLSAEAALHHLLFTHEDVGRYDTCYKTLPPLRDQSDVDALIAAVNDGTIDCIVSDH
ncbi:dihydroorotase, partial [Acinetobacter baumannii]